jgi:ABC-2 type transport system ATP-binding protein
MEVLDKCLNSRSGLYEVSPSGESLGVTGLSKSFGSTEALINVGFSLRPGEIVGLVGPNGAGKTTLMECMQGLLPWEAGAITLLGRDVHHGLTQDVKQRIGVAPQFFSLPATLTVGEIVAMYQVLYRNGHSTLSVIAKVGLTDQRHVRFSRLSGGQKRRLALALALVGDPDVMFLDEPTGDLDPQSRRFIWDVILDPVRQQQRTVLIASHQMEEVEALCSRVIILDRGRILEDDTPQALISRYCPDHHVSFRAARCHERALVSLFPSLMLTAHSTKQHYFNARLTISDVSVALIALAKLSDQFPNAVTDMQVTKSTLEDVFIRLTGRAIRD